LVRRGFTEHASRITFHPLKNVATPVQFNDLTI
jgi:hypothetical protein